LMPRVLRCWGTAKNKSFTISHTTYEAYREFVDTRSAEVVTNIAICLIHQANYLLNQQIRRLEQDFLKEGGLRERMTKYRPASSSARMRGNDEGGVSE